MTRKISVSVPDEVADYLAEQPNASAEVATAVQARMRSRQVEAMLRAHGYEITDEGRARARRRLDAGRARMLARRTAADSAW